jgi:DNA-binding response OmpR family regulator
MIDMKKILYVEDNPHFSRVISFLLNRAGFGVTHCDCGENALRAIGEHTFDCVITDYRMAQVSGLNVAEISRRKWPDIPIFLLTAIPPGLLDPICKEIADDIFIKPVNCDEFIRRVRQSLSPKMSDGIQYNGDSVSENPPRL